MALYRCTIEVREKTGRMHQYKSDVEAEDANTAADRVKRELAPKVAAELEGGKIEEIVCMAVEGD